ncbi:hypothetical protein sync_0580 [Synechococcus sp. CC9311]|nr:hypothetical protein sync_0580 [Synechococcus sp. CC9311]
MIAPRVTSSPLSLSCFTHYCGVLIRFQRQDYLCFSYGECFVRCFQRLAYSTPSVLNEVVELPRSTFFPLVDARATQDLHDVKKCPV